MNKNSCSWKLCCVTSALLGLVVFKYFYLFKRL